MNLVPYASDNISYHTSRGSSIKNIYQYRTYWPLQVGLYALTMELDKNAAAVAIFVRKPEETIL